MEAAAEVSLNLIWCNAENWLRLTDCRHDMASLWQTFSQLFLNTLCCNIIPDLSMLTQQSSSAWLVTATLLSMMLLIRGVTSQRNITLYPACVDDQDCDDVSIRKQAEHRCFQYMCYPTQSTSDADFTDCRRSSDCAVDEECFRHPDRRNVFKGICLQKRWPNIIRTHHHGHHHIDWLQWDTHLFWPRWLCSWSAVCGGLVWWSSVSLLSVSWSPLLHSPPVSGPAPGSLMLSGHCWSGGHHPAPGTLLWRMEQTLLRQWSCSSHSSASKSVISCCSEGSSSHSNTKIFY